MKAQYKLFILVLFLLALPLVSAQDNFVYQQSNSVDLKTICFNNGLCSTSATCNISVYDPNNNVVIDNQLMTVSSSNGYHNYTLNTTQTATLGVHTADGFCKDGSVTKDYTYEFQITPNGEVADIGKSIFYIGILILTLVLFIFSIFMVFKSRSLTVKFIGASLGYLTLLTLSYFAWIIGVNFLSFSVFAGRFFWIIFRLLLIGLFPALLGFFLFYVFQLFKLKEINSMIDRGIPMGEAFDKGRKKGFKF